jgi:nucleoid-associated protein YgaU
VKKLLKKFLKQVKINESTISTILGAIVIVVIGVLIFNYFRGVKSTKEVTGPTVEKNTEGEVIPQGLPTLHKVEAGENLWKIAEKYYGSGYNWVDVAKENKLSNPSLIAAGQELNIPSVAVRKPVLGANAKYGDPITGSEYTVVKGDHLWGIAIRAYGDGYKWVEIAKANNLANPNLIHPGNVLVLPR